ncbi:hypothetical protein NDK47_13280 [Brevibacillus ruminantium]|uniref:DUF3139 domain-containing protein n=1 Tax=Brevibacillus ruminantium TaxID=2950604 RepID=A0ABY4WM02_9BACL|nr:hypothetical protein [Brevibacillus ruminantium]USG68190.1 hypothetical protein NDK47_13280 [Brevibacillus ruminantium]
MEATKKSKLMILLFLGGAILLGALGYFGMSSLGKEQVAYIKSVISDKGGSVDVITVVPKEESPFTESGKGNTIYKIDFQKDGKALTAWYRSNNQSSIIKENEEWIFPE